MNCRYRNTDSFLPGHDAKQRLLERILHSNPLEVIQVILLETQEKADTCWVVRPTPGSNGYKRHAAWYAATEDLRHEEDAWNVWRQGQLHVVLSSSAVSDTYLHFQGFFFKRQQWKHGQPPKQGLPSWTVSC